MNKDNKLTKVMDLIENGEGYENCYLVMLI